MIIAVLQMQPVPALPAENFARIRSAALAARAAGASLLVTPELSLTGYAIGEDLARLAEPADGPLLQRLRALAVETELDIVAGFPERDGPVVYNSAALVQAEGVTICRKCHLYGAAERRWFTPSPRPPPLVTVGALTAALMICYDVEFPELARRHALAGAELLIVPTALPDSPGQARVSDVLVPARALENHLFIAYAGLCGQERGLRYAGRSVIVGPDGIDLARAGGGETLLITRIDPAARAAAHDENPYFADRRSDLYAS